VTAPTGPSAADVQHGMPPAAEDTFPNGTWPGVSWATHIGVANASERTAPRAPERGRVVMWVALPIAVDDFGALAEVIDKVWPGATVSEQAGGYAIREAVRR